jgi:hypothetical protein
MPDADDSITTRPFVETKSLAETLGLTEEDMVSVGGVNRPKRDLASAKSKDSIVERATYLASLPITGETEGVPRESSPQVSGLYKDLEDGGEVPEARSILIAPEPFDREKYTADPNSYLSKIRPNRALQALEPGPGVEPLRPKGGLFREILQGEKVILEVQAEAGMPVTFHAQLGQFDNKLKTMTVASSSEGLARVNFSAVSGVHGNIKILAASPVHSNRLNYVVKVSLPN